MINGNFVEHLGRCIYDGLFEPGSPLSDKNGYRSNNYYEFMASTGFAEFDLYRQRGKIFLLFSGTLFYMIIIPLGPN